jgi:glucose/arabinose dehydrogenase
VLELSASIGFDGSLEGPRSLPFAVVVAPPAGTVVSARADLAEGRTAYTADGLALSAEVLAEAVRPVALRFAPDGRLFVAEQDGRIRVVEDGVMRPEPALVLDDVVVGPAAGLLDMALAPDFDRSRLVYVVYTTNGRDGLEKVVTRYREVGNQLGEPAVLIGGIPAAVEPDSAALAFGPDGTLFVLTGQPADARAPQPDLAEGQLLRLNPDGTTPRDNPAYSPIVRRSVRRPVSVVWTGQRETLLLVQGGDWDAATGSDGDAPVVWRDGDRLVVTPPPTSTALCPNAAVPEFRGDLFMAAPESRALLRLPSGQAAEPGPVPTEPLFANQLGPIAVVACSPDGDLYVATRHLQAQQSRPDWVLRITAR